MSLIQEALRRQQQEQEAAGKPPAAPQPGAIPPPPPATPSPSGSVRSASLGMARPAPAAAPQPQASAFGRIKPAAVPPARATPAESSEAAEADSHDEDPAVPEEKARPLATVLGIVLLLILLLGGGSYAIWYGLGNLDFGREESTAGHPPAPEVTTPAPVFAVEPPATTPPGNPLARTPEPAETPVTESPAQPAETPIVSPQSPQSVPPTDPASTQPTPIRAVAPSAPKPAWPFLQLTGVVGRDRTGSAIMNSQIIDVGSAIEGVKVIGIERNAAWLEYKGEKRLLRVGKTTE